MIPIRALGVTTALTIAVLASPLSAEDGATLCIKIGYRPCPIDCSNARADVGKGRTNILFCILFCD